jgi:hypothetical protein
MITNRINASIVFAHAVVLSVVCVVGGVHITTAATAPAQATAISAPADGTTNDPWD